VRIGTVSPKAYGKKLGFSCIKPPFAALADRLATVIDVDDAVIDGELIATDDTGRPQFYDLLRSAAPIGAALWNAIRCWAELTHLTSQKS